MPHGISDRKARRLADEVSAFMQQRHREIGVMPQTAGPADLAKFGGLDYTKSANLSTYLKGLITPSVAGSVGLPSALEVAEAAEAFGRAMGRQELLTLAADIRKRGL